MTRSRDSVHTEDVGSEKVGLSEEKRPLCPYRRCLFRGDMVSLFSGRLFGTLAEKADLRVMFFTERPGAQECQHKMGGRIVQLLSCTAPMRRAKTGTLF